MRMAEEAGAVALSAQGVVCMCCAVALSARCSVSTGDRAVERQELEDVEVKLSESMIRLVATGLPV